ncbi:MAG: hypothetical protein SGI97_05580 [candidate division Zixibacteria bacterium]|nr:hypothetical protein [candidate division Zixibacteria bacterium]
MRKPIQSGLAAIALLIFYGTGNGAAITEIVNPKLGEIHATGFELSKAGEIQIEAVGLRSQNDDNMLVYAWIIDAGTREAVWVMREQGTDRAAGSRSLRKAEKTLMLEAGRYEAYLYSGPNYWFGMGDFGGNNVGQIIGNVFFGKDDKIERYIDDCYVKISSATMGGSDVKQFEVTGDMPGALFKANRLRDSEHAQWGFTLDKPSNLRIYAILEQPDNYRSPVDGGWIVNADTREKVWVLDRWDTERAGGGKKNRRFDDEIRLEKGNYVLHFVTDDSHSFEEFNANPPVDPFNWGITVLPGAGFDNSALHTYTPPEKGKPLIDFTRARDNDNSEQAFTLTKEAKLYILAVGEFSNGGDEFADYGWIQNATTGKTVWEMTDRNTEHAGGAEKNRMFDGTITLPAGDYIAYFSCDDSHAYRSWNSDKPFDPKAWGLAIYPTSGSNASDFKQIALTEVKAGENMLVNLTRVKDDEHRRGTFTLDKPATVRVYALGEGTGGDMSDYGWIESEETGDVVWEMTWRNSRNAGGAVKNRVYDGEIELEPGTYKVFYESDGSHSFNEWNASRPRDYRNWGITVSLAGK